MKDRFPGGPWRVLVLFAGLLTLSGCQVAPVVNTKPTTQTLLYTYLIAHGMARASVMSGETDMHHLPELLMLDRDARNAVLRQATEPGSRNMEAANEALMRLIGLMTPKDRKNG